MSIRINKRLYEKAKTHAHVKQRTIAGQIEFWATLGKAGLDNPDLPIGFVRDLIAARSHGSESAIPFVPKNRSQ
jgi:ParD-like antitoxin of type II bacterial toxin-antitoxin system